MGKRTKTSVRGGERVERYSYFIIPEVNVLGQPKIQKLTQRRHKVEWGNIAKGDVKSVITHSETGRKQR